VTRNVSSARFMSLLAMPVRIRPVLDLVAGGRFFDVPERG
jgi:hypothetical protein